MKKKNTYILVGLLCYTVALVGQSIKVNELDEVRLSDVKIKKYTLGAKKEVFTDSISRLHSNPSLVNLLRNNTTAYFRENGIGGVTSIRLRGTNASQTAVVWNGIPINSQLNGQTDFSALSIRNYDNISVRTGGGVAYGSSAIGGTVALNSVLNFEKHLNHNITTSLASFTTSSTNYKVSFGNKKFTLNAGVDQFFSKNNYKFLGKRGRGRRNKNGELENYNFNINSGFFINEKHLLKFFHNSYLGKREFANSLLMLSNDDYRDHNLRNMFQWVYLGNRFKSTTSIVHLFEEYRFFDDKEIRDVFSFGKATNTIIKHDAEYRFSKKFKLKSIIQFDHTVGRGSDIRKETRNRLSFALLSLLQLNKQWSTSFNIRQEINELDRFSFKSFVNGLGEFSKDVKDIHSNETTNQNPFVASWDNKYIFNKLFKIKTSISNSFRLPTFNDLYWNGSGGIGNPDLLPERAVQAEVSPSITWKGLELTTTAYFINTKNQIVWRPISTAVWSPINVSAAENYGAEISLGFQKQINKLKLNSKLQYAHTIAKDKDLDKQVLFVPTNTIVFNTAFEYKKWAAFYQFQWNDEVFITTDNTRFLEARDVSNIGVEYVFTKEGKKEYSIGITANNIFNEIYELTAARPALNRNYQLRIALKL